MRRRVIIIVGVLLSFAIMISAIIVNRKFQPEARKEFMLNEWVNLENARYNVQGYSILTAEEYENQYGAMTAAQRGRFFDEQGEETAYMIVLQCSVEILSEKEGIAISNLHLQSGAWNNGVSNPFIYAVNPQMNEDWKGYWNNGGTIMNLPFTISKSVVKNFSLENIKKRKYEFILNMTPVYAVKLN